MTTIGNCTAEGCQVANGGSCIEGFDDLAECPNVSRADVADSEAAGGVIGQLGQEPSLSRKEIEKPPRPLYSGNALAVGEAHELTGECASTVVILMGMVKSGKTTVLAEIYEHLCKGPFAGYLFAGSRTIMGFEQICHLSRAVSQGEMEDTDRTKRGAANNLLHLDLVAEENGRRQRLLITDLSGELFEEATLASENLYSVPYLTRADQVVIFADAEKLSDVSERHDLVNQLLVLLRCCIEESRLKPSCRVTVIVSRHDLLPADMDQNFLDSMQARIRQRTCVYFDEPTRFLNLAARPASGPANAHGLSDLLVGWFAKPHVQEPDIPKLLYSAENIQREIDKFAFKVSDDE